MPASKAPQAVGVEVVPAQTTEADDVIIKKLAAEAAKRLPGIAFIVKIKLKTVPEPTSQGWALYVDDLRIPKYWAYDKGIYFKVFDPQFFEECKGGKLRFSQNGTDFIDTGLKLAAPRTAKRKTARRAAARLPRQDEVLNR